jgi:hypothetical protein
MSNSNPTLLRLFGRSRYVKHYRPPEEDDKSEKAKQDRQERERWVVAALGHVLTYDRRFREEFWRSVCCEDGNESPRDIKVTVEPKNSADLCLTASWENRHIVCVIEAKLGAPLAPHQDPDNKKAFLSDNIGTKPKGYGKALQDGSINSQSKLRYVVLGHQDELGKNPLDTHPPIQVLQHSWSSVANITPRSDLVRDLFATLAAIGIREFAMKYLEDIKIKAEGQAVQAVAILEGVCEEFQINLEKRQLEAHYASPNDHCLGIYIKSRFRGEASRSHRRLIQATKTPEPERISWFGFVSGKAVPLLREVWFWTDTLETAEDLKMRLKSGGIPEDTISAVYEDNHQKTKPYVLVSEPAGGDPSDVKFFRGILRLVAGIAKR